MDRVSEANGVGWVSVWGSTKDSHCPHIHPHSLTHPTLAYARSQSLCLLFPPCPQLRFVPLTQTSQVIVRMSLSGGANRWIICF